VRRPGIAHLLPDSRANFHDLAKREAISAWGHP
jgi:hypothetical protein